MIVLTAVSGTSMASEGHEGGDTHGSGALFKNGQGLLLSKVMAESIKLQTAEVAEESMIPVFFVELQTYKESSELSGWIGSDEAGLLKEGTRATLKSGLRSFSGKVKQVKESTHAAGGDYEIMVEADEAVAPGTPVTGTFTLPAREGVLVVPSSSLLKTAEGKFVYAKSGDFYVRTPVKTGNVSDDKIEILDGLYSGDEVVTSPVMQLWLAELQAIRGGQSCADGH